MGVASSLPGDSSQLSADQQSKVYRQLEWQYAQILKNEPDLDKASVYAKLEKMHEELVVAYSTASYECPKVRFGRTEIQMPILSLGGMRQQETWAPRDDLTVEDIQAEVQKNFEAIADRAMELGINHFETARGYGSSELQFGPIVKKYPRDTFILQTKVVPKPTNDEFRALLETSFTKLQLNGDDDYVDLFAFHGINTEEHLDWVLREGGNMEVIKEYVDMKKIRHIGFSTHGMSALIKKAVDTGAFDYVNLHYHWCGSYTATGTSKLENEGNLDCVEAAKAQDMGVFIISPTDKGGALYEPPQYLCDTCAPLPPIVFNNLFLWSHDAISTLVIGAARPADLDEHTQAVKLYSQRKELSLPIMNKLKAKVAETFDPEFYENWFKGLPTAYENDEGLPIANLFWLWWLCKAWGMYNYALKRYSAFEGNISGWDDELSVDENRGKFSWVPGIAFRPAREDRLRTILEGHARGQQIADAIVELHGWLHTGGCIKRKEIPDGVDTAAWKVAYDLQPSKPYPER